MKACKKCINCGTELEQYSTNDLCDFCASQEWEKLKKQMEIY